MQQIREFLGLKRVAIVGVSRRSDDFSRALYREFRGRGYDTVPVHPQASEIEGQPCFARLEDVAPPVEGVLLMTSPEVTDTLVRDCAKAGVGRVWMYRGAGTGAVSPQAVAFCEANGISVIAGECPMMFLPGTAWYHRFHGLIRKIARAYPA
jgi:predicted CoA-binding protein